MTESAAPQSVGPETTQVVAPGAAINFSQLEAAVEAKETAAKVEAKAEKKEILDVAAKVAEKVADKLEAGTQKQPAHPKKAQSTPDRSAKTYEFVSADGTKVSVPADYKVVKKVDGKEVEATLADLADEFAGRTAWDKRFNEFAKEKKGFESQVSYINEKVDKILATAKTEPMTAFYEICRLAGKSPSDVTAAMGLVGEQASRWQGMNEVERKAAMLELENGFYRASEAEKKAEAERKERDAAIERKVSAIRGQYGMTDEAWAQGEELARRMFKETEVGPEHIVQAHRCQLVAGVLEESYPEGMQDSAVFDEVFKVAMTHPEFDANDLKDIVTETFASASAKRLGRKVTSQTPEKKEAPRKTGSEEPWSFDQI